MIVNVAAGCKLRNKNTLTINSWNSRSGSRQYMYMSNSIECLLKIRNGSDKKRRTRENRLSRNCRQESDHRDGIRISRDTRFSRSCVMHQRNTDRDRKSQDNRRLSKSLIDRHGRESRSNRNARDKSREVRMRSCERDRRISKNLRPQSNKVKENRDRSSGRRVSKSYIMHQHGQNFEKIQGSKDRRISKSCYNSPNQKLNFDKIKGIKGKRLSKSCYNSFSPDQKIKVDNYIADKTDSAKSKRISKSCHQNPKMTKRNYHSNPLFKQNVIDNSNDKHFLYTFKNKSLNAPSMTSSLIPSPVTSKHELSPGTIRSFTSSIACRGSSIFSRSSTGVVVKYYIGTLLFLH